MTQKGRSTRKKENSLEKGEPFLVQTSMNDLIKDESQSSINNNNDKRIESSVDLSDIKEIHKNETKELNCEENKRLDNNLELKDVEDNIIDVKIENEEQETENKELLKEVFDIEKQDSSGNEKLNKEELTEKESEESIALQKKKLDEVEQSVSKQKSKKGKLTNLISFIVNLVIVGALMAYQLTQEEFVPLTGLRLNGWALLISLVIFGGVMLTDMLGFGYLLKQSTGKSRLGFAFKLNELGRYYDAITPMAAGGQPFEITYLKSRGVPVHTALSIPLAKYLFSQIAWVIVSFICLIVSFVDNSYGTFVSIMSIIGFVCGFFMLALTLFLSICKTVGKKLVVKGLKLLQKMKIVKNYDKQYEKVTKYISDFQDVMKQYAKSPKDFIVMMFLSLAKLVLNYSIPYFVVMVFMPGLEPSLYVRLMVLSVLVDVSASFFPTPGGAGISEISFASAFGSVVGENNVLVWVILLWRFYSYYIYLLKGIIVLSYDMAYGNRKYKWQVKREKLVEESMVFKQSQIDKFRADRAKRRRTKQKTVGVKEYL